jgi:glucose-1-phosphate adenylyltransferase
VFAETSAERPRVGTALDSMVCPGAIVSGGRVERSIISQNVRVNSWAEVADSILFDDVDVGRNAVVKRAIIDKRIRIPAHCRIGVDAEADRARELTVTEGGITVVSQVDEWKLSRTY